MKHTRLHLKFAAISVLLAGLAPRPAHAQITTEPFLEPSRTVLAQSCPAST